MRGGIKQVLLRSKGQPKGESLPPGAPGGVVCGEVSALRSVDFFTASRLRRADTPIRKERIPKRKPTTIAVHSRALSPRNGSTYFSGKAVQTNRATSDTAHLARGLPALLTVFDAVLPRDVQRVIEHQLGCFETHAMLALVDFVFGIVPRKQV